MARRDAAPSGPSQRQLRVGEEIRRVLARVFERGGLRDPDLHDVSLTVTEVSVAPDMRQATVWVLPLGGGDDKSILDALGRASGHLSGLAARELSMKYVPRLSFKRDTAFDTSSKIDALLRDPVIQRDVASGAAESNPSEDGDGPA